MTRTKSSSIARVVDLLKATVAEMDNVLIEHQILIADSDRLKEIEPALKKLQAALTPPPLGEPLLPDSISTTGIGIEAITSTPIKRIRKKKGTNAIRDTTNKETPETT